MIELHGGWILLITVVSLAAGGFATKRYADQKKQKAETKRIEQLKSVKEGADTFYQDFIAATLFGPRRIIRVLVYQPFEAGGEYVVVQKMYKNEGESDQSFIPRETFRLAVASAQLVCWQNVARYFASAINEQLLASTPETKYQFTDKHNLGYLGTLPMMEETSVNRDVRRVSATLSWGTSGVLALNCTIADNGHLVIRLRVNDAIQKDAYRTISQELAALGLENTDASSRELRAYAFEVTDRPAFEAFDMLKQASHQIRTTVEWTRSPAPIAELATEPPACPELVTEPVGPGIIVEVVDTEAVAESEVPEVKAENA